MTKEEQNLEVIRSEIAELPLEVQARVKGIAEAIRAVLQKQGAAATMAFALIGLELSAKASVENPEKWKNA